MMIPCRTVVLSPAPSPATAPSPAPAHAPAPAPALQVGGDEQDNSLVLSFVEQTRVLTLTGEEVEDQRLLALSRTSRLSTRAIRSMGRLYRWGGLSD